MSSEQDPAFWRQLYKAPSETEEDIESTGFRVVIEASDLIAERTAVTSAAEVPDDSSGGAQIDPAKLNSLLDKMLKKKLAAMAAKGMLAAPVGSAPPRRREPGEKSAQSATPTAAQMATLSPEQISAALSSPEAAVSPPKAPEPAPAQDPEPWESDAASMTIDDNLPPWEEAPEAPPASMDTQASTVMIDEGEDFDIEIQAEEDDEEELFVAVEDEEGFDDFEIEMDDEDDDEEPTVSEDIDTSDWWGKVPALPGGQSSLIGVDGLSPAAPMVLVLIDGVSTLKGLKMLVPHVPDDEFLAIVKDGVGRGLVVF